MAKSIERRMAVAPVEVRDGADGVTLVGYASTFNQPYDMGWYRETVAPGAFTRSLGRSPDVRLLVNHNGLPLARTTSGTLSLSEDGNGLMVEARLDPSDPDVAALLPKMRRGDLNQMSFGFRVLDDGDEWSKDMSQRTLRNLDINDGDVSVVTYPANPNAKAGVRSDGHALDAVASAVRCLESRAADAGDITSVLNRALEYFARFSATADAIASNQITPNDARSLTVSGATEVSAVFTASSPISEPSVMDDSARAAAKAAHEARERELRLLG